LCGKGFPGGQNLDGFEHFTGLRFYERHVVAPAAPSLVIIDTSRLRRDCLRAALGQRLSGWRIRESDCAREFAEHGDPGADLILLGGSRIDSEDVIRLAALAPVVVCSDCEEQRTAQRLLTAGARGFVPSSLGLGALLAAIERVRAGGRYIPAVPAEPRLPAGPVWHELTRRQREVLALITEGKSNKLIADALDMSEDTVKVHVKQIIKRLNVANRTQAALLATGAEPVALRA
jgi:DNA-binding NarL/FixJ family response regulator